MCLRIRNHKFAVYGFFAGHRGGLEVLVNNVGGTETKPGGFEVLSDEDWQTVPEVNLLAAVRLDRAFLPGMIECKSGVVIHISSVAHRLPFSNSTLAYPAAKGAFRLTARGWPRVLLRKECVSR